MPWVHPTLSRALELDRYDVETFEHAALQIGEAAPRDPYFELPSDHPDQGRRIAGYYLFIHPFIALNYYPWGISLNALEPLPDERTRIHYRAYVGREELRDVGAGAGLDAVEHEDDAIVERCARGLASRLYRPGQLHPKHEKAVSWFRKKRDCHRG